MTYVDFNSPSAAGAFDTSEIGWFTSSTVSGSTQTLTISQNFSSVGGTLQSDNNFEISTVLENGVNNGLVSIDFGNVGGGPGGSTVFHPDTTISARQTGFEDTAGISFQTLNRPDLPPFFYVNSHLQPPVQAGQTFTLVDDGSEGTFPSASPPLAPVLQSPPNGAQVNNNHPVISGTGQPNDFATIYINGNVLGTASVDSTGHWSFTPTTTFWDGSYSAKVTETDGAGNTSDFSNTDMFTVHNPNSSLAQIHANDLSYASTASGYNHFIDLYNFEASFPDLIHAFGTNQQQMQDWYTHYEPTERRVETFDGLDYIASYGDLINAYRGAGSTHDVQDAGATHYINYGQTEGRTTTFNGLDYIASYGDLVAAYGANSDAGAYHFIEYGSTEGRTTTFDGLDYIASYADLIQAYGANEQAGAAHFIDYGFHEGRTTTFDGLSYIAQYADLMLAYGPNNDAGASHYITYGASEGRSTSFDVAGYEQAHPDLQGMYATNDQFLTAYIDTYVATGHPLT